MVLAHYPPLKANATYADPFKNPFDRVTIVENPINYGTPYQVLFVTSNVGKHVSSAKREIKFRFGLANDKALYSGLSGMACCGEEHEIKIFRTTNSGKRIVMVDNKEIHNSSNRLDGKFELTWTMCGYRKAKVSINRFKARHFDFSLDGVSFFDFPKISQLGTNRDELPPAYTSTSCPNLTPTTGAIIKYPPRSRFPFSFLSRKTMGQKSRSCPAIDTYKQKKLKDKYSYQKERSSTLSENTCDNTTTASSEEYVEYNKRSRKYIVTKPLPGYAAVC